MKYITAILPANCSRVYIAGPMTGMPDFNFPAFNAEAAFLRNLGFTVENPAENTLPADSTWETYLKAALRQMLTCDAVVFLPGWLGSRGARLEMFLAKKMDMDLFLSSDFVFDGVSEVVAAALDAQPV